MNRVQAWGICDPECRKWCCEVDIERRLHRGVTRFDASYSAAETTGEAEEGVESAGGGRTARGEITSEGDTVLRRSRRRTGLPDYYVP
ncbi:hypothetical protein BJX66DRAFT_345564 [Aspergillus keveii]|uniref:Uncharacterized protein n=1 Tax=Aspergillus keveii TaxID=714993 RepID=A0ABR4FHN5_9EURO